jgi:hypothetical protein
VADSRTLSYDCSTTVILILFLLGGASQSESIILVLSICHNWLLYCRPGPVVSHISPAPSLVIHTNFLISQISCELLTVILPLPCAVWLHILDAKSRQLSVNIPNVSYNNRGVFLAHYFFRWLSRRGQRLAMMRSTARRWHYDSDQVGITRRACKKKHVCCGWFSL